MWVLLGRFIDRGNALKAPYGDGHSGYVQEIIEDAVVKLCTLNSLDGTVIA